MHYCLKSLGSVRLLFCKDAFKWSKVSVKPFTLLQNISVFKKCCSFFIKRSYLKSITASTNIVNINNLTVFNIDDDAKCFLSSKSACYNDFEGPYDTEIGVMAAENSALLALTNTLFVTYTIIQSIMRREMCSLHLTHPSAHTLGAVGSWHCSGRGAVMDFLPEPGFEPTTLVYLGFQVQRSIH